MTKEKKPKLSDKPSLTGQQRKAWLGVVLSVIIIISFWFIALGFGLYSFGSKSTDNQSLVNGKNEFSKLINDLKQGFGDLQTNINRTTGTTTIELTDEELEKMKDDVLQKINTTGNVSSTEDLPLNIEIIDIE